MGEELVAKKRSAAIKLGKDSQPFDPDLGEDFVPVYIETVSEEIKQIARDIRKFAKLIPREIVVVVDGEEDPIAKLLRRQAARLMAGANNLYEVGFIDFEKIQEDRVDAILEDGDADDDDQDTE